jgi:hypothetical protein
MNYRVSAICPHELPSVIPNPSNYLTLANNPPFAIFALHSTKQYLYTQNTLNPEIKKRKKNLRSSSSSDFGNPSGIGQGLLPSFSTFNGLAKLNPPRAEIVVTVILVARVVAEDDFCWRQNGKVGATLS